LTASAVTRVGVIGLGNMGRPIAENLRRGGCDVVVWDIDPERARAVAQDGRLATSVEDLAVQSDAVFVAVPGPRELEQVAFGPAGALAHMPEGSIFISLSTVTPAVMQSVAEVAAARAVSVLDCPVTGAADGARAGTLTLMLGGEEEVVTACEPLLELISAQRFHLGPVGAGSVAKLLTNMLWFTHVVALSDALGAGVRAGLDAVMLADVIRRGAAGSWVAEHDLPNLLQGDDDVSFTLALCCKDLSLISTLLGELDADIPLLAGVRGRFERARDAFGPHAGELAVARLSEKAMGVSIRAREVSEHAASQSGR